MPEKSTTGQAENRYIRPTHKSKLTSEEKTQLLIEHFNHYAAIVARNPGALNAKVPRSAFEKLLNDVGVLLLTESKRLANSAGPVHDFLKEHPLPALMGTRLPPEFRVFCLVINALKQWVAAEQAATDRYLLGGTARARCRAVAKTCLVSGNTLDPKEVELHHPVRDGRPPIPLSKAGHASIENQLSFVAAHRGSSATNAVQTLKTLKAAGHFSWVMLRRGCLDCLGQTPNHSTPGVGASSRTFARKAMQASGLTAEQILEWLDENKLGMATPH